MNKRRLKKARKKILAQTVAAIEGTKPNGADATKTRMDSVPEIPESAS
jgi:hypothetical protein